MDGFLAWWWLPLSGSSVHAIDAATAWHGRVMVLAWGVLVPLAALLARYFKVMPGQDWPAQLDNPAWWHGHRALAGVAVALTLVGAGLMWERGELPGAAAASHRLLGLALVGAGLAQLVLGLLRGSKGGPTDARLRGDHYDMTPRRGAFERLHKSIGWLAWVASVPCTVLGLVLADAPRAMLLGLALWWLALAAAFVRLQRSGRCLDTYQAIWGPDPRHPGNQVAPVGWGIRREPPDSPCSPWARRRRTSPDPPARAAGPRAGGAPDRDCR